MNNSTSLITLQSQLIRKRLIIHLHLHILNFLLEFISEKKKLNNE